MSKIIKYINAKPHIVLWSLAFVFLAYSVYCQFYFPEATLDINVHDTYFVISHVHFFQLPVIWFGLCGLAYWVLFKFKIKLINWLTITHLVLTFLLFVAVLFPNLFTIVDSRFDGNNYPIALYKLDENSVVMIAVFFLGLVQLIYFLNIFISLVCRRLVK